MPLRIGIMLYPLLPFAAMLLKRGSVSKFLSAGATSPQTARRPQSLQAGDIEGAVRSGVLVPADDGMYFVDLNVYRRQRRRLALIVVALVTLLTASAVWIWWPDLQAALG